MLPRLHLDFETRSFAPFGGKDPKSVGLDIYAVHPTTSVWCFAYRFGDKPVQSWWRDQPLPLEVIDHVRNGYTVVAHNARFERKVWNGALTRMMNGYLPGLAIEQMDCTMARAQALGLPADLARAARVVGAAHQKDVEGGDNMLKMAKPRKVTWLNEHCAAAYAAGELRLEPILDGLAQSTYGVLNAPIRHQVILTVDWWYDLDLRAKQDSYCRTDVMAECGVDSSVTYLPPKERKLWEWNERVNDRGIPFDTPLIKKIQATVECTKATADARIKVLTGGFVTKCTQHARVAQWLATRGIVTNSVAKGMTEDLLAEAINDEIASEVIILHSASSKSSTSKMGKALQMLGPDNCVRGVFTYHGTAPGRFTAMGYQAQNLVRVDEDAELPTVREIIKILDKFEPAVAAVAIDIIFGKGMHWLSKCTRPTIRAPQGKIFRGVDLSNIQGRLTAWHAGEQWKLDAFAAYDRGEGADLYKITAGELLNISPYEVTKIQRQALGKVPELASGFQGSVAAYVRMGMTTGVRPEEIADVAAQVTDPAVWAKVEEGYRPRYSAGLERSVWTGVKVIVNGWRAKHPRIVQSWWDRQDAVLEAVGNPGQIVSVCDGKIRYMVAHNYLWCMLASGKMTAYPQPSVVSVPYLRERTEIINGVPVIIEEEAYKNAVQVWGIDGTTKQWAPYALFGGILTQNDALGMERELMFDGALRATDAGYEFCFHCHDELLAVIDPAFGSRKQLEDLVTVDPGYAAGLPLAAKAWEDERYVK